jgi:hypothetical protein
MRILDDFIPFLQTFQFLNRKMKKETRMGFVLPGFIISGWRWYPRHPAGGILSVISSMENAKKIGRARRKSRAFSRRRVRRESANRRRGFLVGRMEALRICGFSGKSRGDLFPFGFTQARVAFRDG